MMSEYQSAEHRRLADSAARRADWKGRGPYLSERAWGAVREDHSNGQLPAYEWALGDVSPGGICDEV